MKADEAVHLCPATDHHRVILCHTKAGNWIPHKDRTEQLVAQILAGGRNR